MLKLYVSVPIAHNNVLAAYHILQKLNNNVTKLSVEFWEFILPVLTNINKTIQSQSPRLHTIYKSVPLRTIFDCFANRKYLHLKYRLEEIDFKNPRNSYSCELIICKVI